MLHAQQVVEYVCYYVFSNKLKEKMTRASAWVKQSQVMPQSISFPWAREGKPPVSSLKHFKILEVCPS